MAHALFFCTCLLLFASCHGQTSTTTLCTSALTGSFGTIIANGTSCALNGVTAQTVQVSDDCSLRTTGATQINTLTAQGAGDFELDGATSVEDLTFQDSGTLSIGRGVTVTQVNMINSGSLRHRGSIRTFAADGSGPFTVMRGGSIGTSPEGEVRVTNSRTPFRLCGASLGNVFTTNMQARFLGQRKSSCEPSSINALDIVAPVGHGFVQRVNVNGSFSVRDGVRQRLRDGSLRTFGWRITSAAIGGPITIRNMSYPGSGRVRFMSVTAEDSVTLIDVGSFKVSDSNVRGVVKMGELEEDAELDNRLPARLTEISRSTFTNNVFIGQLSGNVTISDSSFAFRTVAITSDALVTVARNRQLDLTIRGNGVGGDISSNSISDAVFRNNRAELRLSDNTFETLSCRDNEPAPSVAPDNVIGSGDGQCA